MAAYSLIPIAGILGYLLGSVPVGLLVGRLYGIDIRTVGSGRTGGTNAWRAAGLKAAVPTILGDALKGVLAVLLVRHLLGRLFGVAEDTLLLQVAEALAGGAAVWGHNWSVYIKFKGGAGGITAGTTAAALFPPAGFIVGVVGALLIWWSRIASVGTFAVGATAFASFLVLAIAGLAPWPYLLFGAMALIGIFSSLRVNRERMKSGEERVITIW